MVHLRPQLSFWVLKQYIRPNKGLSAKEIAEWAQDARNYIHGYLTLETLDALAAGGRIPAAAANIGGKLDVKPELTYDSTGALTVKTVCRAARRHSSLLSRTLEIAILMTPRFLLALFLQTHRRTLIG